MPDFKPTARGMQAQTPTTQSPYDLNGNAKARSGDGQVRSRVHSGRPISSIFPVSPQDDDALSTRLSTGGPDQNYPNERRSGENGPTTLLPNSVVPASQPRSPTSSNGSWVDGPDYEGAQAQPNPVTIGDSAPIFLKDTRRASSQVQTPDLLPTPKSGGSSNRTPTQADFSILEADIPQLPSVPIHHVISHESREQTTLDSSTDPATSRTVLTPNASEKPSDTGRTVNSGIFAKEGQIQGTQQAALLARDDQTVDAERRNVRDSEDSAETYHTANGGDNRSDRAVSMGNGINHSKNEPLAVDPRTSYRDALNRKSQSGAQPNFAETVHLRAIDTETRPFSFIQFGQMPEDLSLHGLGNQTRPGDRTETVNTPVHHDTTYDFTPTQSQSSSSRSRPRSFSRPFQDPNVHQHPAFRQDRASSDIPSRGDDYDDPQTRRDEARLPHQQGTEYEVPGVGPPSAEQLSKKSRSRKGSRSSAFLNSFTGSPKADISGKSDNHDDGKSGTSATSPVYVEKRNKRASLFRSFTSNTGDESSHSRENSFSQSYRSQTDPQKTSHTKRPTERLLKGFSRHKVTPSADTDLRSFSATVQGTGKKKKRFSSLGVSTFFAVLVEILKLLRVSSDARVKIS